MKTTSVFAFVIITTPTPNAITISNSGVFLCRLLTTDCQASLQDKTLTRANMTHSDVSDSFVHYVSLTVSVKTSPIIFRQMQENMFNSFLSSC